MATSTIDEPKLPGGYLVTPRVPQGLAAAVEGLTREVIRNSPEDIYVFAAHHFEKLLLLREQCGEGAEIKSSNREGSINTLREMSRALRMREIDRGNARATRGTIDQVGWSLNQTAKVLKRHRSIFGDEGRRITTDEVFRMATAKEMPKSPTQKLDNRVNKRCPKEEKTSSRRPDDLWKASTSRTDRQSWSNEDSIENTDVNTDRTRAGPRIITQIQNLPSGTAMLAKDIKAELRKNRISSRERRNVGSKPQQERGSLERSESKVTKSSGKSYSSKKPSDSSRQRRVETEMEQSRRCRKNNDSTRSSSRERQRDRKSENKDGSKRNTESSETLTPSMDRVKDYVSQRFATTRSLEELQTSNYVEKVQEIIDETGPIIKEKIEELKSGMIGRSEKSCWLTDGRKTHKGRSNKDSSSDEKRENVVSRRQKNSPENVTSEGSTTDALRTRLTETQNLMENVSSSLTRSSSSRRSRSARSSRRSENFETHDESSISKDFSLDDNAERGNRDKALETRLSRTRDLLEDISSTLSKPTRRSSSAKSLRKSHETTKDTSVGSGKDALKKRLDETRNLLRGISASFGAPRIDPEESIQLEPQADKKVSLPAVKSHSMKNSSGSASRSESDNLVLPAISPEAPRSTKIREDLILPVLSPPGTASTNEDSSKMVDTNDDVPLEDFGIPEIPSEDYVPEVPVDNVSRDSLNVTPNFDSIPQRPDSLEPVEILDGLETKTSGADDLCAKTSEIDDLRAKISEIDDLRAKISKIDDANSVGLNDLEAKTSNVEAKISGPDDLQAEASKVDDLGVRLQEIEKVEIDTEDTFGPRTPSKSDKSENSATRNELRELEEAEKRIDGIFDTENHNGSKGSEEDANAPLEHIDGSTNPGTKIEEEMSNEMGDSKPDEFDESTGNEESKLEEPELDVPSNLSPEPLNYTYVLTEGSPYDIPDTVTTVIIPERTIDSPLSDRSSIELVDGLEPTKLSLIPGVAARKRSIEETIERDVEFVDENLVKPEIAVEGRNNSDENAAKSGEDVSSPKNLFDDPFGEFVGLEPHVAASQDIDFIREIESIQEMQLTHQDLGRINEEVSEDLEDLEGRNDSTRIMEDVENAEEATKEETLREIEVVPIVEGERNEEIGDTKVEESKVIESDLSPEATRPYMDSESSNEAKESSAADEPLLESTKQENSIDDDEESSDTRTPESSNEVKETTLTDGLSLSLDPTRPFVPELNLDSLQDITVSSFKMTEEDCENGERGESENTNSITETLTSDENNRTNDNNGQEELAVEYIVSSASSRSRIDETRPSAETEVVEDTIVKSRVEVKEDICEKASTYVTGPSSNEDENIADDGAKLSELEDEKDGTLEEGGDEEKSTEPANMDVVASDKEEENAPKMEEVEIAETADSNEDIVTPGKEEAREEIEEITKVEDSNETVIMEIVETEREEGTRENGKIMKTEDSNESEDLEVFEAEKVEEQEEPEERVEEEEPGNLVDDKKLGLESIKKDEAESESSAKLEVSDPQKSEEIANDPDPESLDKKIVKDSGDKEEQRSTEYDKSGDLNELMRTEDEESDEILEEGYVEDETPLAVSRSASQCTTRRVSSGNLAKLGEDPTVGWTEETEREDEESESDPSSSKVKFSRITGQTIREQGSDEMDQVSIKPRDVDNETSNEAQMIKDSREYHIYVPEVDASGDNSSTESSTFDSAVTKIQAGVRGFLARRRLQRGQQNRSSTLSSVPSIQDSVAIEPNSTDDREHGGSGEKDSRDEGMIISSSKVSEDNGLVNAATRIQSNFRGYKARKRLRREDAVQRTTLSLEKSFADSGLQHTGEFHDCIPLPFHDVVAIERRAPDPPRDPSEIEKIDDIVSANATEEPNKNVDEVASPEPSQREIDREDSTTRDREKMTAKASMPVEPGKMFFGQSSNVPIIQFGMSPSVSDLLNLVVLAKDDAALQSGYLNFITSVEDTETIVGPAEMSTKNFQDGEKNYNESLKEPLALSDPPIGAVIEEVTSFDAENFMKVDEDHGGTMASPNSSLRAPEVIEKSPDSPRTPCASLETVSASPEAEHQAEGNSSNRSAVGEVETGSSRVTNEISEHLEDPEERSDNVATDRTSARSPNVEKIEEIAALETESMTENFLIPESLSSLQEKALLGPESSVDSIECPIVLAEDKNTFESSDSIVEAASASTIGEVAEDIAEKITSPERDSSDRSEITEERAKEVSIGSNVDEPSSTLSFSMKVEDLLVLGSEESVELPGRKPILEVTLTPRNIMKSTSLSQESQLAGERIESPVTMIQIAPERSESLKQDELSDNGDEEDAINGKKVHSPSSAKSEKK